MTLCPILTVLVLLFTIPAHALNPMGTTPQGQMHLEYVDASDPLVQSAANFAAKEIERGTLYKTIFAQKEEQDTGDIYVLTIEVVDFHRHHHRYSVQIYMPSDGSDWQVIYFAPVDH